MAEIAVIGTGYVGLTTGGVLRPPRPRRRLRRHRRRTRSSGCSGARSRSSRPASTTWSARASRAGGLRSCSAPADAVARLRVRLPVRAHAPGRRRLGRPDLHRGGRAARSARVLPPEAIVVNKSTVPVGSTQVVEQALGRDDVRRGVEPRVPPRGLGGPRLPEPRPHRDRRRRPGRGRSGWRRCTSASTAPADRHRPGVGRDDQVRRQRLPRHEDQLRQRHRRRVRGRRRRRQRRRARHGLRQAHRPRVPEARARAGGAAASRRTPGRWSSIAEDAGYDFDLLRGVIAVNDEQFERVAPRSSTWRGGSLEGVHGRGVGAHVQGPHRRPARLARRSRSIARLSTRGAGAGLRPRRQGGPPAASTASRSSPTPTPPARAPTCSSCSPSGTSSAGSTSTRSPA